MLYVDGLLNDNDFSTEEKRDVITEAFETRNLPIDYILSVNITNPAQIYIILESMERAVKKKPRLATKKWLAYVQCCMESDSQKVKQKAMRVLSNISSLLANASKKK